MVAYFTDAKAVKGTDEFSYSWNDTKWLLKTMKIWCCLKQIRLDTLPNSAAIVLMAFLKNHTSPTNPEAFTILNDKLYLNYSLKVKENVAKAAGKDSKADSLWTGLNTKN